MSPTQPLQPREYDPARHPRKLNLGCGPDHRPGYLNVDLNAWHGPDLVADVRELAFMPSQYYEEILAQDVLEHLPRVATLPVLASWNRLLRPGGSLRLRIPSVLGIARQLEDPANAEPDKQEELIQCLFGTQAYSGDFHYTGFTEVTLRHALSVTGFEVKELTMAHGWLYDATAVKRKHFESSPFPDFTYLLEVPGDEDFIGRCYADILRRQPDEGGASFFRDGLRRGMSRGEVIQVMLGGEEYRVLARARP